MHATTTMRNEVRGDHDVLAPDAIIQHARGGSDQSRRQHLQHQRQADGLRFAGELQQEAVEGDDVEPVAQLADDLGQPQTAEVPVVPEQPAVGGEGGERGSHEARCGKEGTGCTVHDE